METDLQYYTRRLLEERRAARVATSAIRRHVHQRRAGAFELQLNRLAASPMLNCEALRLRPAW